MARWTEIAKRPDELVSEMHEVNARLIDMLREQQALAAARKRATIRFGIPKKLQPLLRQSNRWGRIKPEVVCAMTSKYAIALYELVQLRRNLDRCVEMFPIDRFRELLGVPPSAYARGNHFIKNVIEPAVLEVNGLSDTGVQAAPQRRSRFAPINAVTVAWWRKEGDEFRAAMKERNRSKVGRMARLRGNGSRLVGLVAPGDTEPDTLQLLAADLAAIAGVVEEEAMCGAPATPN